MLSHRRSRSRRKFSNIWVNRQVTLSLSPWLMDVSFLIHHRSKFHIHTCSQSSFVDYTANTSVLLLHQLCFTSHASHNLKNFTGMPLCHHRACFGAEECVVNVCLCHLWDQHNGSIAAGDVADAAAGGNFIHGELCNRG